MGDEEHSAYEARHMKIFVTCIEMLKDRGYTNNDNIEMDDVVDEGFDLDMYGDLGVENNWSIATPLSFTHNTGKVLLLFFAKEERIGKPELIQVINKIEQMQAQAAILVTKKGAAQSAIRKVLEKRKIEHFEEDELLYNVTHHELVPRHRPMSEKEQEEFLKHYSINVNQIPVILSSDPIVRYLGAAPGTVLEITRRSETCGRYITYRLVK